ncbi:PleD family two-component system response regulator [Candidatus Margulisiibacteriota bacterium]
MSNKPLVMVVDDEVDLADTISNTIRESGKYVSLTAYSAKEALGLIEEHKNFFKVNNTTIRLIILDIKMPEMDGLEFLAKVRETYPPEKIGVLMLTAWEDPDKWEKAREGFVVAYLKKPFKADELLSAIDRFFAGKDKWMIEQTKWETHARETKLHAQEKEKKD